MHIKINIFLLPSQIFIFYILLISLNLCQVEEGRNICIYGSENLDWIREFSAKMKEIKDAGAQLEMIYVGQK